MRIAAAEKLGFYPTPPHTLQLITNLLKPAVHGGFFRLLDPCAGEGEALAQVVSSLAHPTNTVASYGVELSDVRAQAASAVFTSCIQADWQDVTTAHNSFSLIWVNPPYDTEASSDVTTKRNRLEYTFLRNTLKTLQPGGLLVYIVPLKLLERANVSAFLAGYFEQLQVFALPPVEFAQFGQIVLFGYKKESPAKDELTIRRLQQLAITQDVPCLTDARETLRVPVSTLPESKFFMRKITLYPQEVYTVITTHGLHTTAAWRDMNALANDGAFQPVVPLRTGHIGSMISSGQMGTILLNGHGDKPLLAKGRSIKVSETVDDKGNVVKSDAETAAKERERFETRVFTLDGEGVFTNLESVGDLQRFLESNAPAIAQVMQERYAPLYAQPTLDEWRQLAPLLKSKKLPGRAGAGLLPAQKHVAIAGSRCLQQLGYVEYVCEMGCGKTAMSLATLELLPDAYPALVLSPGHIVKKWAREVEDVIPGARGVVIDSLAELVSFALTYVPGDKVVVIMSKERAKLGSGWQAAVVKRQVTRRIENPDTRQTRYVRTELSTCPKCGAIVTDEEGLPLTVLPNKRLYCMAKVKRWVGHPHDNSLGEYKTVRCGAPLFEMSGLRRWPLSRYIRTKMPGFFKVLISDEYHLFKGKSTDQAGAYHDLVMATRYQINLTGTLFGGKSTDLFWLRYRVDSQVRKDFDFHDEIRWAELYGRLERTIKSDDVADGVFSGRRRYISAAKEVPGISPAIFARLLKSCIFMRISDLGFKLPAYDEHIIHLPMAARQREQYDWLNAQLMAYVSTSYSSSKQERMISQKLLGVWLQNCLGRVNSGFRPETVMYSVNKGLKLPVPVQEHDLPDWMELAEVERLPRALPHLEAIIPGQVKEDDVILHTDYYGDYALHLEPVVTDFELLPKEEWVVETCVHEQSQDRKVLVYVRQTGTRDIQPRLKQILEDAGLSAVILPDSIPPKKREQWIHDQVGNIDVLIVNPQKVATGLDLVMFSTAIFYEIEYSLFVIWQAMRRVWRLGQTQPVKVLFPVYENSMESAALALMGQKMQAALLLYGDTAASAITDEAGSSGDFTAELAARLLDGEELSSDGITGLLKQTIPDDEEVFIADMPEDEEVDLLVEAVVNQVVELLASSADAEETEDFESFQRGWEYWAKMQQILREEKRIKAGRRRKKLPESQLLLFEEALSVPVQASQTEVVQLQPLLFG